MNKWSFLNKNWDIISVLILYSLLAIFSLQFYQYKIAGDEISYINIAHAYAAGHWENAINGYWSPLFSWLMTPILLLFGFKPIYGVYISKAVSIIIGFFTILSIRKLSQTFNLDRVVQRALLFASIPSLVFFSILYNTPDLLLVCFLVYYLSIIFDSEYPHKLSTGVICGFVGAAAYLTKSFAFPFFLFHYILFNVIFYFRGLKIEREKILKNLVLGLSIFFVVSGLWAGIISDKYGKATISTAGEYNQALVGPEYKVNTMDNGHTPLSYMGLITPPNNDSTSIWDDPSYEKMDHWNIFNSWKNFEYELNLILSNLIYSFNIIESFMPFAVVILFFMVLFILRSRFNNASKNILKYLLVTMIIYIGGYCLIIPEWRYLWFIFVLLMVSSFFMIDRLHKTNIINLQIRNIFLILLICSFVIQPTLEAVYFAHDDNRYNLSNTLKGDYGVHGNLASNEWGMMTIAYYLNSKYYGATKKGNNVTQLDKELKDNNIDYYFVWNPNGDLQLSGYREITNGKISGLRIYSKI
jgi:hypothetical protein